MEVDIRKEMTIGEILELDVEVAPVFLQHGMHCLGCPVSRAESLEDACMVHRMDPDVLVQELKDYFAAKAQ